MCAGGARRADRRRPHRRADACRTVRHLARSEGGLPQIYTEIEVRASASRSACSSPTARKQGKVQKLAYPRAREHWLDAVARAQFQLRRDLAKIALTAPAPRREREDHVRLAPRDKHWRLIGLGARCKRIPGELRVETLPPHANSCGRLVEDASAPRTATAVAPLNMFFAPRIPCVQTLRRTGTHAHARHAGDARCHARASVDGSPRMQNAKIFVTSSADARTAAVHVRRCSCQVTADLASAADRRGDAPGR